MTKILVNGLSDSAGKTTATRGLYHWFEDLGNTCLFKPLAANDYWYDHEVLMEGLEDGRLYGKDAKLLSELVQIKKEKINPVHRLWAPTSAIVGESKIEEDSSIILDRIVDEDETKLIVNSQVSVPGKLQNLFKKASEVREFSNSSDLNEIMRETHLQAIKNRLNEISDADFLILESYSDVSMPISFEPDSVVTVEPGRAFVSNGSRFSEAHSLIAEKWGIYSREISTNKVIKSLNPEVISINPSTLRNKSEIKNTYEKVFEYIENSFL